MSDVPVAPYDVVQLDPERHPPVRATQYMTVVSVDAEGVHGLIPLPRPDGTPASISYVAPHGTYAWIGRAAWIPTDLPTPTPPSRTRA